MVQMTLAKKSYLLKANVRRYLWGYLFILPWIIGLIVYQIGPIIASLFFSFTQYDVITPMKWIGLANYKNLVADPLAVKSLIVTMLYVALSVPARVIVALTLAMLLNAKFKGKNIFRTIYYLPSVTAGVAISIVWLILYDPLYGPIDSFLKLVGIPGPNWLADPNIALVSLAILGVWIVSGRYMVIFLAGLQGLPEHLYESATIDGANAVQKFFRLTLPLMSPTLYLVIVLSIIQSFQVFVYAQVMTQGGPDNATLMYVLYMYRKGFVDFQMGYASALGWVLFLIIFSITLFQNFIQRRWVYYESRGGR